MSYCPDRGDIVTVDYDPQTGREMGKVRPALVLSPKNYNRQAGLMLACPITSKVSDYPFEVSLPAGGKIVGAVLADRPSSLDWRARNVTAVEKAPAAVVQDVQAKLGALIL